MKAKIVSKYAVSVIDYDTEIKKIDTIFNSEVVKYGVNDDIINSILAKKDDERTIEELQAIVKRKELNDWKDNQLKELDGYLEFVPSEFNGYLGEYDAAKPYYVEEDEKVVQKWEVVENDKTKILSKIDVLKSELEQTDYKVIKCYEAALSSSSEMPYDVNTLISERQAKRDEINSLQELITEEVVEKRSK